MHPLGSHRLACNHYCLHWGGGRISSSLHAPPPATPPGCGLHGHGSAAVLLWFCMCMGFCCRGCVSQVQITGLHRAKQCCSSHPALILPCRSRKRARAPRRRGRSTRTGLFPKCFCEVTQSLWCFETPSSGQAALHAARIGGANCLPDCSMMHICASLALQPNLQTQDPTRAFLLQGLGTDKHLGFSQQRTRTLTPLASPRAPRWLRPIL